MVFFQLFLLELENILMMDNRRGSLCVSSAAPQDYNFYDGWWLEEPMRNGDDLNLKTGELWEHCSKEAIVPAALHEALSAVPPDHSEELCRLWCAHMANPLVLYVYEERFYGGISIHASVDNETFYVLHAQGAGDRHFWSYTDDVEIFVRQVYTRTEWPPRAITEAEWALSPFTTYNFLPGFPPIHNEPEAEDYEPWVAPAEDRGVEAIVATISKPAFCMLM